MNYVCNTATVVKHDINKASLRSWYSQNNQHGYDSLSKNNLLSYHCVAHELISTAKTILIVSVQHEQEQLGAVQTTKYITIL